MNSEQIEMPYYLICDSIPCIDRTLNVCGDPPQKPVTHTEIGIQNGQYWTTQQKPLISQGLLDVSGWCRTVKWWRWWESNPRPNALRCQRLR